MSVDLTTTEARNTRLAELAKQTAAITHMPRDTTEDVVSRFHAHADVDTAWAELYAAEAEHQRGSSVSYWALMDAMTARAQAAAVWRQRAEKLAAESQDDGVSQ